MKETPPLTSTHRTEPSGRRMRCSLITMPEPRGLRISIEFGAHLLAVFGVDAQQKIARRWRTWRQSENRIQLG